MTGKNNREFREWNDLMALKYNPDYYHTRSHFLIRWIERLRVRKILRLLNTTKSSKVLEVGCGAGNIMQKIIDAEVICGIDVSRPLLTIARGKQYSREVIFVESYAENMPFEDAAFDRIYCSEVLEHVQNPESVCKDVDRLMAEHGLFVVSVPYEKIIDRVKGILRSFSLDKIINRSDKYKVSSKMTDEWHLHEYSPQVFKKMLAGQFEVVSLDYVPCRMLPLRMVALCRKKQANF